VELSFIYDMIMMPQIRVVASHGEAREKHSRGASLGRKFMNFAF